MSDYQDYEQTHLQQIIEAALLAAGRPLTLDQLSELFITSSDDEALANEERKMAKKRIRPVLKQLQADCELRCVELIEVASGWRYQVKQHIAPHIASLWNSRPSRYSRAMLETLALIAYRQPTTRSEIEKIRGVSVSSEIMKKLLDYGWIRVVGQKNTAGHPRLYGTTTVFLDHFSLKELRDLPPLEALKDNALEENQRLNEEAEQSMQERLKQADEEKQKAEEELRRLATEAAEKMAQEQVEAEQTQETNENPETPIVSVVASVEEGDESTTKATENIEENLDPERSDTSDDTLNNHDKTS